jgi:hypothetical protein
MKNTLPLLAVAPFLFASCASIVRHPEVDGVKKIAIVSLYSNQEINKVGGGASNGGGLAFLSKAANGKDNDDSDSNNRTRMAKYALERYTAALSKVPGWVVVSTGTVVASNTYKKLGEAQTENRTLASVVSVVTRFKKAKYSTPPKMWAIDLSKHDADREAKLVELSKSLGVDAVAVIDLDLAYQAGMMSIGGTGAAHASVASSTKVLNKDGKFAVKFPESQTGKRFDSDTSMAMLGGQIHFIGDTEKAFKEAIDKNADYTLQVITEGLQAKK